MLDAPVSESAEEFKQEGCGDKGVSRCGMAIAGSDPVLFAKVVQTEGAGRINRAGNRIDPFGKGASIDPFVF